MDPLPNWRSIWDSAAESARSFALSLLAISTFAVSRLAASRFALFRSSTCHPYVLALFRRTMAILYIQTVLMATAQREWLTRALAGVVRRTTLV